MGSIAGQRRAGTVPSASTRRRAHPPPTDPWRSRCPAAPCALAPAALFLGHTLIAIPVVVIIVGGAFRRIDPAIELAARSCGASFSRAFWHVAVPAARPAILSAGAFAFLTSFDEVVLTLFLGGPKTGTLPKKIWESVRFELDPSLTAVSTILVLLSVAGVAVAQFASRNDTAR